MHHRFSLTAASAAALLLAAAPPAPPASTGTTISGVAVDGYLNKAVAFLDLNDNGVYDTGEPTAVTDASGAFPLSVAAGT